METDSMDNEARELINGGTGEWKVERDVYGFASHIMRDNRVILILISGTCRNEACIEEFVKMINRKNSKKSEKEDGRINS